MLIYKGGDPEAMQNMTDAERKETMDKWGEWMAALQQKDQLSTGGSPLHYSGKAVDKDGVVTDMSSFEIKEMVTGYSIIKANDMEEAVEMAKVCPIFEHPKTSLEVREIMQLG